jgi:RimJ/RimL family protein N-acetyltransferase
MSDVVSLREVQDQDIPILFEHQRDPIAHHMVAFTSRDRDDWAAFAAHWDRTRKDPTVLIRTILSGENVAGYITSFAFEGAPCIGYWLGRSFWGQGIATRALAAFLELVPSRPQFARIARDNAGSLRVAEKCGFVRVGEGRDFSRSRGVEVEELILKLS